MEAAEEAEAVDTAGAEATGLPVVGFDLLSVVLLLAV